MADITLTYKGETIAQISSTGSLTMQTRGMYCEDNITLSYIRPSGGGGVEYVSQDSTGFLTVLEPIIVSQDSGGWLVIDDAADDPSSVIVQDAAGWLNVL